VDGISSKTRRKIKNELLLEREFLLEGESKRLVPQEVLSRKKTILITNVTVRYLDKKIKIDHLWVSIKKGTENMDKNFITL